MHKPDYLTLTTTNTHRTTSVITVATQYLDTVVTTNVSTVIRALNQTTEISVSATPDIPNPYNDSPGPSLVQIGFNQSLNNTLGATL